MTSLPPTENTLLLQKGIAAARSGHSTKARQLLEQVVDAEPHNEMAWLWLSGLVTTNEEKRACLEAVLQANPENVYAQAGLTRLPIFTQAEPNDLEARLASVTPSRGNRLPTSGPQAGLRQVTRPTIKRLSATRPTNGRTKPQPEKAKGTEIPMPPSAPGPTELTCPACDEPVAAEAKMCPCCFIPFKSVEELLSGGDPAASTQSRRKRRKILTYLGFSIGA